MSRYQPPVYTPPTLLDRLRGRRHHNCPFCYDAERYPHLKVNHPPEAPPPPPAPMGPRR